MRRLVLVIYSIVFLDAVLQFALVPLLPDYATELGLSKTEAGVVVATYSGFVLLAALPAGHVADRLGARRLTVAGCVLLTVSTGAYVLADGFWLLVLARAGQGIASAISWTAGLAWLSAASAPDRRARLLGGSVAVGSTGALVGPVIAGPLGQAFGIRAPFVLFTAVAAVLAVWCWMQAETRAKVEEQLSIARLARLSTRSRMLAAAVLVTVLVAIVSGALETLVPLSLGSDGWSATEISVVLGAAGVLSVLTNVIVGRVYERVGGVQIGTVAISASAVGTALLVSPGLTALALACLYVLATPAMSAQYAISFPMAADGADEVGLPHGVVLGAVNVCWGLGFTIGPAAGAAIAEASSDSVTYALCAVLCVAAVPALRALALPGKECQEGA